MKSIVGWMWVDRCIVCNRLKYKTLFSDKSFLKPEALSAPFVSDKSYYTYEELQKLYPLEEIINLSPWEYEA